MKTRLHRIAPLLLLTTLVTSPVRCQNWPQWLGPDRDGRAPGFTAPAEWPAELKKAWQVTVGQADATPALMNGKLYVFARQEGDEVTLALDAATGKELWRDAYAAEGATGPASRHAGPRSSPVVMDGKVITFGVRGTLSCLDATSGKVLWRKNDFPDAFPRFFTSASPVVANGLVIAQVGGGDKGGIAAYDLGSGDRKWLCDCGEPAYASPTLATLGGMTLVVALTGSEIVVVDLAGGAVRWRMAFTPQRRAYNAATPIVDGATVYVSGAGRGTKAIGLSVSGTEVTGKELWANADVAVQFSTPLLKDGLLYGLTDRGSFFCLNAENGQTLWTDPDRRGNGYGCLVDGGKVLLATSPDSELIVLAPGGDKYTVLAKYKVAEGPVYAFPVPSGNHLYIQDNSSLTLWAAE
ncbi:MAG: PQQ-like beta-propeller repeat protein [Verrucomicrobiales bacterium]|nr:PQQ-like beta-propeller repeat protein [Verrucomicrobiales bacterium]